MHRAPWKRRPPVTALKFLVLVLLGGVSGVRAENPATLSTPTGLLCDLTGQPSHFLIGSEHPRFGWVVPGTKPNDAQTAYRILVATSATSLDGNEPDAWDSGRIASAESINIEYAGKPLQPSTHYSWKVQTWGVDGVASGWSKPQEFTTAATLAPYMTPIFVPAWRAEPAIRVVKEGPQHYFVDFGKDAFGALRLTLAASKDGDVEVWLGEKADGQAVDRTPEGSIAVGQTIVPIHSGSATYDIHPPSVKRNTNPPALLLPKEIGAVIPFRYAELLHCPGAVKAESVHRLTLDYPQDDRAASFSCSDTALNQVWDLCKYSAMATNSFGIYVDGDRERRPYEADSYIHQLMHYSVDREFVIARASNEYLLRHPTWPTEWKFHSVFMTWADYLYTGDSRSLEQCYEQLKAEKTLQNLAREDGLLNTKGQRDIVDWPTPERDDYQFTPINTVVNSFYYATLLKMAELADAVHRSQDAADDRQAAQGVRAALNQKLFDSNTGLYIDGEGVAHSSLHANLFPLAFGLVPPERQPRVLAFIKSKGMACSPYPAQYLLEGLYESGAENYARQLMTSTDVRGWLNMIRVGSTITLEAWDIKFKKNLTWNHAWGGAPADIISGYLLGVRPLQPGFAKALIRPRPGTLKHAEGVVPTIRGPVHVVIDNATGKSLRVQVELPANMTADVNLPVPHAGGAIIKVLEDGRVVAYESRDGGVVIPSVGSGPHTFAIE